MVTIAIRNGTSTRTERWRRVTMPPRRAMSMAVKKPESRKKVSMRHAWMTVTERARGVLLVCSRKGQKKKGTPATKGRAAWSQTPSIMATARRASSAWRRSVGAGVWFC